jgi:hypothetical protein
MVKRSDMTIERWGGCVGGILQAFPLPRYALSGGYIQIMVGYVDYYLKWVYHLETHEGKHHHPRPQ